MNKKTPAEIQIEYLKKLKQGSQAASSKSEGKAAPASTRRGGGIPAGPAGESPELELAEIRPSKKRRAATPGRAAMPAVKVDRKALERFRERQKRQKTFKKPQELWDWVLRLSNEIPLEAGGLSEEAKQDFFNATRKWLAERGIGDE